MFCAECGERLADGTNFCPQCGTPIAPVHRSATGRLIPAQHPAATAPIPTSSTSEPRPDAGTRSRFEFDAAQGSQPAQGLFARVKSILLSPLTEWPVIAAESSSSRSIYLSYVAPLVAIGVIAEFLGQTLVGVPLPLSGMARMRIVPALAQAISTFALSFVGVFLVALIVNTLASVFGGRKDALAALKVTVYSHTPAWVAGVLHVVPALGVLAVLAAFYGLYLLYLGLPVLMRTSRDEAVGYTVVTVFCAMVTRIAIAGLGTLVAGAFG